MPAERGRRIVLVIAGIVPLLAACSPSYVGRAAYEEARMLWRRQPIEELLVDPALTPAERKKLELVLEVRSFAEKEVGLRVRGSYRSVSKVDAGAIVYMLTAARRDRLESYTWWFPFVGRVPYQGFFSREAATASGRSLEEKGYDTYVRPAIAFSTLGWFDDPVPSTLLERDAETLAEVIFHELFHATLFVPGEIAFNESAANFVGSRAAVEFFCVAERRTPKECDQAVGEWQDAVAMSRFLSTALERLEAFYSTKPDRIALEEGRKRGFAEIREAFKGLKFQRGSYAGFTSQTLNNASLLQDRMYFRDLEFFDELYRQRGRLADVIPLLKEVSKEGNPFTNLRAMVGDLAPKVAARD
jgi:predicted aminopeptidase